MYKKHEKNDENFWISYADLMAGLLFVFILVIGAIVIKYLYTQASLDKEKNALNSKDKMVIDLKDRLAKADALNNLNLAEIQKLKDLLLGYELKEKETNENYEKLSEEILNQHNMIALKENEIASLAQAIIDQAKDQQKLVEEFDITKAKIKDLTGIKLNVITKLKDKLGNSIDIDDKTGAIKFSSNILFDQGQYKLKEEAKKKLSTIMKQYLQTLLTDEDVKKYIQSITIEGHTNSDGSYLTNLDLSQKRALEVMQFLYEANLVNKDLLGKFVSSSGKSSSDLVYKNGAEDKDASRRIEIKFVIKNETAIKELQNYLEKK